MIGDHFTNKWAGEPYNQIFNNLPNVSREEFDVLKKDVEEMKELLKRGKEYDMKNNEPNCEIEEKMIMLRKIAEAVGIQLDDIIKN